MGPMDSVNLVSFHSIRIYVADDTGDMDLFSLPFELGSVEGGLQNVTEQDVPLQSFGAEWFR